MRILIPLDGSVLSERALAVGARLAHRAKLPVTLVLLRAYQLPPPESMVMGAGLPVTETELRREVTVYLNGLRQRHAYQHLQFETLIAHGPVAETITDTARQRQIDLVLIASHGRTGVPLAVAGSVAEDVARDSGVPTLIVRELGDPFDADGSKPLTILVPLDGSKLAEASLDFAKQFAVTFGAQIRLLEVLPDPPSTDPEVQRPAREMAQNYLASVVANLREEGVTAYYDVTSGRPTEQIEQEVWLRTTDLVAIATHGRTGFDRLMKGSVAYTVLHNIPLPVMIVHPATVPATVK